MCDSQTAGIDLSNKKQPVKWNMGTRLILQNIVCNIFGCPPQEWPACLMAESRRIRQAGSGRESLAFGIDGVWVDAGAYQGASANVSIIEASAIASIVVSFALKRSA